MTELPVYNLEFPSYISTMDIGGYKFKRVPKYSELFPRLQHKIDVSGGEFPIKPNTGTHQLTALVELPDMESECLLPWATESKFKKIQDILLFLSLFTGRNVFALNPGEEKYPLRPDPRGHFWGGQLRLSARKNIKWKNKIFCELREENDTDGTMVFDWNPIDLGLEDTINEIMKTLSSKDWRDEYDTGYFILVSAKQ